MRMNNQTKLVFALEHIAHLHDLFEDNEFERYLQDALYTLEFECERQLKLELDRKSPAIQYQQETPSNEPRKPLVSAKQAREEQIGIKRR